MRRFSFQAREISMRSLVWITTAIFCCLQLYATESALSAPAACVQPDDWHTRADADRDRVYQSRTGDVFFFEYTPEGAGETLQGNPFWVTMKADPGKIYDLKTAVKTGNGTTFLVKIQGAVDSRTGQPIELTLGPGQRKSINRKIKASENYVDVYVRGEHYIKFWSFVGPTTLCGS
jgi:hypothetical protein